VSDLEKAHVKVFPLLAAGFAIIIAISPILVWTGRVEAKNSEQDGRLDRQSVKINSQDDQIGELVEMKTMIKFLYERELKRTK
jgi:hypothetical protein